MQLLALRRIASVEMAKFKLDNKCYLTRLVMVKHASSTGDASARNAEWAGRRWPPLATTTVSEISTMSWLGM